MGEDPPLQAGSRGQKERNPLFLSNIFPFLVYSGAHSLNKIIIQFVCVIGVQKAHKMKIMFCGMMRVNTLFSSIFFTSMHYD